MISRRAACLRLLWRQEGRQLFPVGIAESGQSQQRERSGQLVGYGWGLMRTAHHLKLSGSRLVLTPKVGPVQSPGLLFLRFAQRLQEATHLWYTQRDPLVGSSTFFSCSWACLCSTSRAA